MQEGFLSVWKSSRTYRPEKGPAEAWLLTLIRNRTIDILRRSAIDSSRRASDGHLTTHPAPDNVCEDVLSRDTAHRLQAVLALLPAGQREVMCSPSTAG
jgi:RNA polymerase sigma-70 factor (ECF subfamily)